MDTGKEHHPAAVIDADGKRLLSWPVANDDNVLLTLLGDVAAMAEKAR